MVKIVLIALSVIASVAIAFPAQNSEDLERIPVRIVRSADPHHHRKYGGFHGGYPGGYDGGYGGGGFGGGYGGGHGHGGGGYNDYGYGGHGHNHGGGYNSYPHGGSSNSQAQASASSGNINTPFGSASFATANSAANSNYGK